jgi:hypothetical protein
MKAIHHQFLIVGRYILRADKINLSLTCVYICGARIFGYWLRLRSFLTYRCDELTEIHAVDGVHVVCSM